MRTYEPGTVAIATVRGVPNVRIMWRDVESGYLAGWWTSRGAVYADSKDVTDIRPLVVLDLDAANDSISRDEVVETAIRTLKKSPFLSDTRLAQQIAEQATKPPRIPEPGWGERVVASVKTPGQYAHRQRWVGILGANDALKWVSEHGDVAAWDELIAPDLVRDGIEDES